MVSDTDILLVDSIKECLRNPLNYKINEYNGKKVFEKKSKEDKLK